ncbi:MAG: hypothetical protein BJ554DRAFT_6560 [Olpidium bornovanus]|uniref:Uncharacterized protein n=1 Tax=Olpidium bornovanus TaxID=278681 RepID=A0A8H8DK37_9FUNG|nr:MAG: hypothetical protein BJ554DRAFT_6560 [Olpidium bornovanus]
MRVLTSFKIHVRSLRQGAVISAKANCNGTLIGFLAVPDAKQQTGTETEIQLYVLDIEKDSLNMFDFSGFHVHPLRHYWDGADPRLLVCQTEAARMSGGGRIDGAGTKTAGGNSPGSDNSPAAAAAASDDAAKEELAADEVKVEAEVT